MLRNLKRQDNAASSFTAFDEGRRVLCEASLNLYVIRMAWNAGLDLEDLADGYGPGMGTNGDWSGIRDSSPAAVDRMLEKALNFIEGRFAEKHDSRELIALRDVAQSAMREHPEPYMFADRAEVLEWLSNKARAALKLRGRP